MRLGTAGSDSWETYVRGLGLETSVPLHNGSTRRCYSIPDSYPTPTHSWHLYRTGLRDRTDLRAKEDEHNRQASPVVYQQGS